MDTLNKLNIDIYADGSSLENIIDLKKEKYIKGFTTNPSLMKQIGVVDYEDHCKKILKEVTVDPVSIEIFTDDFNEMIKNNKMPWKNIKK